MNQGIVKYFCENCKRKRQTVILPDDHTINLTKSANGLVIYSDIHTCKDQIIGVSNVHLDANYAVRGVDYLRLPEKMIQPVNNGGVTIPIPGGRPINQSIPITDLVPDQRIKMVYKNFAYKFELRIGKVRKEEPIAEVISDQVSESSKILYYNCDVVFNDTLESWFLRFIEILDEHPPRKLGLIIEALIFIFENHHREIEEIDEKILQEMFHSHLIKVHLTEETLDPFMKIMNDKFDDTTIGILKTIFADLKLNPDQSLLDLAGLLPGFVKFMLNIYILEKLGVLTLEKTEKLKQISQ